MHLHIPSLNAILPDLRVPHSIVAFPIHKTDQYTLFFVIVPPNKNFDWHSHPKIGGISKCIHGRLRISTIDVHLMQVYTYNTFLHPKNKMIVQDIIWTDTDNISKIEPNSYNIHQIEALEWSAFVDLLVSDYPDNTCQFFTMIGKES